MHSHALKVTTPATLFALMLLLTFVSLSLRAQADTGETINENFWKSYRSLPMSFEVNHGQTNHEVKFLSRGNGYTLFLTPAGAVLGLKRFYRVEGEATPLTAETLIAPGLTISFVGADTAPRMVGLEELPGKVNYIKGSDSKLWRTNIPTYARVKYGSVYPGIDVVHYGNQRQLEFDFIVAPGSDPKQIRLSYAGAEKLEIDSVGDLVVRIDGREVRQHRPVVYQDRDGIRQEIASSYVLRDGEVTIDVADYDSHRSLVIDPVLTYSTYLGGIGTDQAFGIAVDSAGNAYVTGATSSPDFPTVNPIQPFQHGSSGPFGHSAPTDVFVTKFNAAGTALVYSTFIGGNGRDEGRGIVVDSSGNAYVAGTTDSTNFPTLNAFQPLNNGSRDGFVLKLNAGGSNLTYSTYLGGSANDDLLAVAVDSSGNAYVAGSTTSFNAPVVNPVQAFLHGGEDAYVAKLNPQGSGLVYSTYLGGSGFETAFGIAIDSSDQAHIAGWARSTDFPVVNAIQPTFGGGVSDAFVAKFNAQGFGLVYSSFLGGSDFDIALGIAADSSGNAYIVGDTFSTNFPIANAIQPSGGGSTRTTAFVTKLNPQGSAFVYSTYLGGGDGTAQSVAVDAAGNAYVTGGAGSAFPLVNPLQASYGDLVDAFISKVNSTGSALAFSTYLGGNGLDFGSGVAVAANGDIFVTGLTGSPNFPTAGPLQAHCSPDPTAPSFCSIDAFVAKICLGPAPTIETVAATPSVLSPPNHHMVPVSVSVSASNDCDAPFTCQIVSVISNEPVEGLGDGDTSPDWFVTGNLTVDLRAERSAQGSGRLYSVTIVCTDAAGNTSTKTVTVTVPRT